MTDEPGWEQAGPIVLKFAVGSGKLVRIAEDGAVDAPVVAIALYENDDSEHRFSLPPMIAQELSDSLEAATEHSINTFLTDAKLQAGADKALRREKLHKRFILGIAVALTVGFSVIQGLVATERYVHHGGVVDGVATGINQMVWFVGIAVLNIWTISRLTHLRARRRATRKPKLHPGPPPEESIP